MENTSYNDPESEVENTKWYHEFPKGKSPKKHTKSPSEIVELKNKAKRYLDGETSAYELKQSRSRSSEYSWLQTALSQGTTSDKVAASVVLIQDSPKHNLTRLSFLVSQVRVAKASQCANVIFALKELFLSDLLHPDHKLLKFEDQNLDDVDDSGKTNKFLAYCYFENQLKESYEKFVQSLSEIAANAVEANREKAVSVMNDLLIGNAEQEHQLLQFLVNKIGDPSSKVTSKVVFCLLKLLHEHSNMKGIVLKEVEKLLFRKNISQRIQYYAICLLTQFVLNKEDEETATYLIDVYFAFFKATLKRGEPQSKMMAAILTGVNRAYPFAKIDSDKIQSHINSVYKVMHLGSFNVSLNALSLLFQVVGKDASQSNRFYSAFYRKLLDPRVGVANKRAVFLNLLFRALRNDPSVIRVAAFIKRIFQVSLYFPTNMACATLYVISQILKIRKDLKRIIIQTESRVKNEVKDKIKLDEISASFDETKDENSDKEVKQKIKKDTIILSNVTMKMVENIETDMKMEDIKNEEDTSKQYDPFCRNPLHAGAYNMCFMELHALASHFHPSVALFANNIIEGKHINYTGDPLEDFTLIRFLDRYVFKNPKKLTEKDHIKKNDPLSQRSVYDPQGLKKFSVNSTAYLYESEDRIPVDELFMYNFMIRRKTVRDEHLINEDDNESVNSEDFNAMLDGLGTTDRMDEMDIATEFAASAKKAKSKTRKDEENESEEGESEDEEIEDDVEDKEIEDLSDLDLEDLDDEASEIDFDENSDEDKILTSKKNKTKKVNETENVFMSAEKFAEMLEEQGISKMKHGMSNAFSDADGSNFKQLKWEMNQNNKFSGRLKNKSHKRPQKFKNKNTIKKQRQ